MEKKETVLDIARKSGQYEVVYMMLKDQKVEEIPNSLEKIFLGATESYLDELPSKIFPWLMQSISDIEPDEDNGFKRRAEKAKELYSKLPTHEIRGIRVQIAQDESIPGTDKFPTLLKTREVILTEITSQCFRTKSEKESRALFSFLMELPIRFKEEKILLQDVIRKTDSLANPDRLEQCFEWAMNKPEKKMLGPFLLILEGREDIAHTLAKGWVKNIRDSGWSRNGLKELLWRMKIFRPLTHSSDTARELVLRYAELAADADRKMQALVNRLKQETVGKTPLQREILGDIKISYEGKNPNFKEPILTIILSDTPSEEEQIRIFGTAISRISEWKKEDEENKGFYSILVLEDKSGHSLKMDFV